MFVPFLFDLLSIRFFLMSSMYRLDLKKKKYLRHFFFNLVKSSSLHIFLRCFGWFSTLLKLKKKIDFVNKDMRKNSSAGHGAEHPALCGPSKVFDQVTSRGLFPPQPFYESVRACVWGLNFIIAPQIWHGWFRSQIDISWGEDLGKSWK